MKGSFLKYAAMAILAGFMLTACSENTPTEAGNDLGSGGDEISLEKEFGGYTASDEMPMFDDTDVMLAAVEDEDVVDAISDEAMAVVASEGDTLKAFVLRIKWGLLEGDSTATEIVDWSGTASVSRGVLGVLKTIRFERGTDFVHLPRTDRKEVVFTSLTREHFDGLTLMIVDADTTDIAGTFTINAGSYSRTFAFAELDSMELVESVGSDGHEVSIVSRMKEARTFDGGFLTGRWIKGERNGGRLYGRWINSEGTNAGHLRGIWGTRENGNQVFYGKYIDFSGAFKGLLKGHWRYTRGDRVGTFRGQWHDRNFEATGVLQGHFKTGRAGSERGFFAGRWTETD